MAEYSAVGIVADAIRRATELVSTSADVDQVIADTVAALWPPQPQAPDPTRTTS